MGRGFKILAASAARAADDKKGEDILVFDTSRLTGVSDYVLVVSVGSPPQLETIEEAVDKLMEEVGLCLLHRDGSRSGHWRVLDYGGLLVHLIHPEAREFYALDKLYHDAPKLRWAAPKRRAVAARCT